MPDRPKASYEVTFYILAAVIISTLVGTLVGAIFDDTDAGRASVGIVAAFCGIAAEILLRRFVGSSLPRFFLDDRERHPPLSVWVGAFVTAVAAGLAASGIGRLMEIGDSMAIGFLAGLLGGLVAAVLVVLHDHETNVRRGVESPTGDAV
ncbi:hypothetical protein PRN20_03135 [Devosia sp. ZB163]|uniref:hypothetical protein n=1 Tax=Devosia sp. ZB163 TaxID=3025938 RepID=UPI0023608FF9|nr:hypothetical protein [Devosia sp. ZB163]MDC9822717.1 hypothetical protein [Devosia sp. ZB163]